MGRSGSRQAAPARRADGGGRHCVPTALRCSALGSWRPTRCAPCGRYAQTDGAESVHEARSRAPTPAPALLAATHSAPGRGRLPRPGPSGGASPSSVVRPGRARGRGGARGGRRGAQGVRPARDSAPRELTRRRLSERSDRRERSELGGGPHARAPQGSRSAAETARVARRRGPAHGPARATPRSKPLLSGRDGPRATSRLRHPLSLRPTRGLNGETADGRAAAKRTPAARRSVGGRRGRSRHRVGRRRQCGGRAGSATAWCDELRKSRNGLRSAAFRSARCAASASRAPRHPPAARAARAPWRGRR
jgi:hypothetical protein